jgi:hypothetical protein
MKMNDLQKIIYQVSPSPKEKQMGKRRHKITFSNLIVARSGFSTDKNNIFVTLRNGTGDPLCTHIRRVSQNRKTTAHNETFGERLRMVASLWKRLPVEFVGDMKRYAHAFNLRYRRDDHPMSAYNIFVKVLGEQDTLYYSTISLSNSLGNTLSDWIESGALPQVNLSRPLNAELIS